MQTQSFGRTGWQVSKIGFGAWEIGGEWGTVDDELSMATLHRALDLGVNFFDTADVYGHSEALIGRLRRERRDPFYIASKAGRRLKPHTGSGYNLANLNSFVDDSLKNLGIERLDLLQLHCPPPEVYYQPEIFAALDSLVQSGKLAAYGVSVQKVEEGLKALEYPNLQSVQIIFNLFRRRPAELFLEQAHQRQVAVIARVPLASGLLTGKFRPETRFVQEDHRAFNRQGAAFDRGETFSGVDYGVGLQAVEELRALVPPGITLAQFALRWILMFAGVTLTIPGARTPTQIEENACAADLPPLSEAAMQAVEAIYNRAIRPLVHHYW